MNIHSYGNGPGSLNVYVAFFSVVSISHLPFKIRHGLLKAKSADVGIDEIASDRARRAYKVSCRSFADTAPQ